MKVLVIPEDPIHDRYILKPVVEQLFADLGRVARVMVLENPRLKGVEQALNVETVAGIVSDNPTFDLFLLLVDRDGEEKRELRTKALEDKHPGRLFACLAVQEVEVWMLALHRDVIAGPPWKADWQDVRRERDPKERFAIPFLQDHAPRHKSALGPGDGRAWAMREIGARWKGVLQVCPELSVLKRHVEAWLQSRA